MSQTAVTLKSADLQSELEEALEEISKITGEITTEDVLDRVFSEFCIGK